MNHICENNLWLASKNPEASKLESPKNACLGLFVKFVRKQWDNSQIDAFRLGNADKFAGFKTVPS